MTAKPLGKTRPRICPEPLRPLNRKTSLGFAVRDFCAAAGQELIPWQSFLFTRALELNKDKTPRFPLVLVEVGRQSGKTTVAAWLSLYHLFVARSRLILGVAADLSLARETLFGAADMIDSCPWLRADLKNVRRANGDESIITAPLAYDDVDGDDSITTTAGGRWKIAAPTRRLARGLSLDFIHADEVRDWRSWDPFAALQPTTAARPHSQILITTNAGDSRSVVLNALRRSPGVGYFAWTAEPDADPEDPQALAQACPGVGYNITWRALEAARDSMPLNRFKPEYMGIQTDVDDNALDMAAWRECADPTAARLDTMRGRGLACCFDASPDSDHFTLAVAVRLPGDHDRVQVELARVWTTPQAVLDELPAVLGRIKPQATAWFNSGPGGMFHHILRRQPGNTELAGAKAAEVCMALAGMVTARRLVHAAERELDEQTASTVRVPSSDGWKFGRGQAPCDSVYAIAGAASTALTLPSPGKAKIRSFSF
jgi:phage terminase large subunit-like protein